MNAESEAGKPGEPEPVDAEFQPADPPADARKARPKKRGPGWFTFVVFIIFAAAIGGAAAWALERYAGPLLPELGLAPRPIVSAEFDASALERRLDALEAREAEPADAGRFAALEERIDTFESRPAAEPGEVDEAELANLRAEIEVLREEADELRADVLADVRAEMQEALTRVQAEAAAGSEDGAAALIEERLAELREIAAQAQASASAAEEAAEAARAASQDRGDDADAAALRAEYAEMSQTLSELREDVSQNLSELRADMRRRLAEFDQQRADIDVQMDALAEDIAALPRAGAAGEAGRFDQLTGRSLSLTLLSEAAAAGEPFEAERAALARLWPDNDRIESLRGPARRGAPSRAELAASFPADALRGVREDRVLFGLVALRGPGDGPDTTGERHAEDARRRLEAGDLTGAVRAAERIDGDAALLVEDWLDAARARLEIDAALIGLRGELGDELARRAESEDR